MVIRAGRKGRFMACSGYPECRTTFSLDAEGKKIEGSRPLMTERKCEKCGRTFWLRLGKRGYFLACSGFPRCRNIKPLSKVEGEEMHAQAEAQRAESAAKRQAPAAG
jgi:DNA topoisomerase-1